VSGSIDESTRHIITKMAHYHFPATVRAGRYIVAMGEDPKTVFPLGCPSADVVEGALKNIPKNKLDKLGVGSHIDVTKPYLLAIFHPITTRFGVAERMTQELLEALKESGHQVIMLWPNIDADSDGISQAIRRFREFNHKMPLHVYKNFEPEAYIPILAGAACAVGNSSSFVRDASYLGVPVVLVGERQDGREWSKAILRVEPRREQILKGIKKQVAKGKYPASNIYGSPGVSKKIVGMLLKIKPYAQKRLHYVNNG
jgi:UDP-hydrolysing UDP-N-acetyl-D-glucosamine 2-epimerase